MTNAAARSALTLNVPQFYADGSGAPGTIECAGYVFSCDYLSGARLALIKPAAGSRRQNEIAARRCEQAYAEYVKANAPAGWLAANAAMYAAMYAE